MLGGIAPMLGRRLGMGGTAQSPAAGPGPATFDQMSGSGMDAMGSLEKHGNFGTQFQSNPGASPYGPSGGIFSLGGF